MGRLEVFMAQMLGWDGFEVRGWFWETPAGDWIPWVCGKPVPANARLVIELVNTWVARCPDCGGRCKKVHEHLDARRWQDLPWGTHQVEVLFAPVRVECPRCQATPVQWLPWADRMQRQTTRLQQRVALEAASAPTSHVAILYGMSWHTVRHAERQALERWQAERAPIALRWVGIDEKYLGRRNRLGNKYVTIVSDLDSGEPLWIGFGRSEATVKQWLDTLSAEQKAAIELFAMDMHEPFKNAIRADPALAHAAIVHDPFHVLKRAAKAVDELRRQTFFRANEQMRALGRGQRWLFLRAWVKCTTEQQAELRKLLSLNPKLAHAYQVVEELREVLHAPDEESMRKGLKHVLRRTARRDNKPLRALHDSIVEHFEEIVALGRLHPPTGRIEALNNNWETAVRAARGYRDLQYLLLKLRFITVNPVRTDHGVRRFLALGLQAPARKKAA